MIVDFGELDNGSEIAADICIIGAGAAGLTLARSLAGSHLDVCVLESGGLEREQPIQSLYEGPTSGLRYVPLAAARLRYFGGSTNHWGGWCGPLDESDFAVRSWVPHSGWPIGLRDLESYYPLAQTVCQLGPFRYSDSDWESESRRYLQLHSDKLTSRFWQFSPPTRFGEVYRKELAAASNVRVVLHANVTELEAEENGRAVRQVRLRTLSGRHGTVRARCYVLACGGIENARLLLLSNRVQSAGLGNRAGLVGRFFMDHPTILHAARLQTRRVATMQSLFEPFTEDGQRAIAGLCPTRLVQQRASILKGSATFSHAPATVPASDVADAVARSLDRVTVDLDGGPPGSPEVFNVVTRTEQVPDPQNRVTLADGKDPLGQNRARLTVRLSALDLATVKVTLTLVAEELGRLQLGRVRLDRWLTREPLAAPESLAWSCHHMGTTRMADDPARGVVDRNCRMHEVDNLYVAGSSVFATSGYMNPTLTIVALALRLGDHLVQRLTV